MCNVAYLYVISNVLKVMWIVLSVKSIDIISKVVISNVIISIVVVSLKLHMCHA
jgi:hypothetical protein